MRKTETILSIIRERGQRKLPVKDAYRLLYQRDLYLSAYGKLYPNKGAMTEGITPETVDGMTLEKIDNIIEAIRFERYRWQPVKRIYIVKKSNQKKRRALGLPTWSDKLLQEVIRLILDAYYEPQFSESSHGFRPNRGCHTALLTIKQKGKGTKWFIEGDISACFDSIEHNELLTTINKSFQDNRFIRLLNNLLRSGYMENWKYNMTYSGAAQGSVVAPIMSNILLDRLDKYIEEILIPAYTRGLERRKDPKYRKLEKQIRKARELENWKKVREFAKQKQNLPSLDPYDPNFRRLWYVRYADDCLLGLAGSKIEAEEIKGKIATFLNNELKLTLNRDKTLITHARSQKAKFLGYEVHVLQEDSKKDKGRQTRSINGKIGLRIPDQIKREKCMQYMHHGKPVQRAELINDTDYSIVTHYQAEYRGIVQYYKLAYNLHTLNKLKYVMGLSLVKTLADKHKTSCKKIFKQYGKVIKDNKGKEWKVILVTLDRPGQAKPLTTYFGGLSLKWDKEAQIKDNSKIVSFNSRTEIEKRLLAQICELCGSKENIEVHHVHKLADLKSKHGTKIPEWKKVMIARQRKTLVVCRTCHWEIHGGKYDGKALIA